MRDQEIELACYAEEGEGLRPMRLRYGITADEASRREPLDVSLNQEEVEQTVEEDGAWDDVDPVDCGVTRTHSSGLPDDLDEEQVAPAAEHEAMHIVNA